MKVLAHWLRRPPTLARSGLAPGVVVMVLLSLLVSLGAHVKLAAPVWRSHSRIYDATAAGALEAIFLLLLVALFVRARRARLDGHGAIAATLRSVLGWALGLGAVALAVTIVVLANISLPPLRLPAPITRLPTRSELGRQAPRAAVPTGRSSHFPSSGLLYALVAILLVLAIVTVVLHARHQRQRTVPPEPEALAEDYAGTVQEVISGGRRALLRLDDARAAIIACYATMEASLADAGAGRAITETPDELLAKAVRLLLVRRRPAALLTSLFYEARFSSHHLGRDQRDAAERALAELEGDLAHPRAFPEVTA